jgi:hypothetical protein
MPARRSDDDLDALLAHGRLSGAVRDRIFDRVAGEAGAGRRPGIVWGGRWSLGLGALAAAAAIVLVAIPREHAPPDALRAKGEGVPAVTLEVSCPGGTLAACPVGATLLFGAEGTGEGFLAAYAQPRPAGERVWYFSADGESPMLRPMGGLQAASRAVRLGAEHAPGPYVLHLFLSRSPLTREALLAGPPRGDVIVSREVSLTVVPAGAPAGNTP